MDQSVMKWLYVVPYPVRTTKSLQRLSVELFNVLDVNEPQDVISSSIGTILKECGLQVTAIKIDPYLNIDAGTFSPHEQDNRRKVFVLDDGGEVDLDLGNYERFLNVTLHRDNNITTGKNLSTCYQQGKKRRLLGQNCAR
ncbi:unnamed protein product [Clavelina lepadiformis]|uniref:CTP synthase N-terminal domain-containing protein n=1 Tax=Clavelina lepadiformis TaxID=159417 RepID=A0ABP0EZ52_CLALP